MWKHVARSPASGRPPPRRVFLSKSMLDNTCNCSNQSHERNLFWDSRLFEKPFCHRSPASGRPPPRRAGPPCRGTRWAAPQPGYVYIYIYIYIHIIIIIIIIIIITIIIIIIIIIITSFIISRCVYIYIYIYAHKLTASSLRHAMGCTSAGPGFRPPASNKHLCISTDPRNIRPISLLRVWVSEGLTQADS